MDSYRVLLKVGIERKDKQLVELFIRLVRIMETMERIRIMGEMVEGMQKHICLLQQVLLLFLHNKVNKIPNTFHQQKGIIHLWNYLFLNLHFHILDGLALLLTISLTFFLLLNCFLQAQVQTIHQEVDKNRSFSREKVYALAEIK